MLSQLANVEAGLGPDVDGNAACADSELAGEDVGGGRSELTGSLTSPDRHRGRHSDSVRPSQGQELHEGSLSPHGRRVRDGMGLSQGDGGEDERARDLLD